MSKRQKTNVEINDDTWQRLNVRKSPGDTFDDVISRILDEIEESETTAEKTTTDSRGADLTNEQQQIGSGPDPIDEIVDEWNPTDRSGEPDETKRAVAQKALEFLKERGDAHRSLIIDAKGEVLPDPEVAPITFWQRYVRPAYKQGDELGYVEYDKHTSPKQYRWIGE